MLVAVTNHAAERFRQRVRGTLEEKAEVASAVTRSVAAGRIEQGSNGAVLVRDLERRDLVYVCRREGDELLVISLWRKGIRPPSRAGSPMCFAEMTTASARRS